MLICLKFILPDVHTLTKNINMANPVLVDLYTTGLFSIIV